jgi:hypothetical protein
MWDTLFFHFNETLKNIKDGTYITICAIRRRNQYLLTLKFVNQYFNYAKSKAKSAISLFS